MTFNVPSNVLANLVFMYFIQALAFSIDVNCPIAIYEPVKPINGLPINGVERTSPIAPEPLASGTRTLYLLKIGLSSRYFVGK